jgi:hypothetical protein
LFRVSKTKIGRTPAGASDCVNWHRDLPELYAVSRKPIRNKIGGTVAPLTLHHNRASLAIAVPEWAHGDTAINNQYSV